MNTIHNLYFTEKYDNILLDIFHWKVYEKFVSINLHVAKLVRGVVNNILKLEPLHFAAESRSHTGGLICGVGFDSAESFSCESFEPELTTEGLVAGQPQTKMESDTHISLHR